MVIISILPLVNLTVLGQDYNVLRNNGSPANKIVLDIASPFFESVYCDIAERQFLFDLKIKNSGPEKLPESLNRFSATSINSLTFQNIENECFQSLLNKFSNCANIGTLILKNISISELPLSFIFNKHISTLVIEDCEKINPLSFDTLLTSKNPLRKLQINNSGLYILPEKINSPYIEVIDFEDNHLTSVGKQLSGLRNLDSLFISGNAIPDPVTDLQYFRNSSVRYIKTDSVSETVNGTIRDNLKNIKVVFSCSEDTTEIKQNSFFGSFKTGAAPFKIRSEAYLHYEDLFSNILFGLNFDTLSFEERFWDTLGNHGTYLYPFRLFKNKSLVTKHVGFGFNKSCGMFKIIKGKCKYPQNQFYRNHPEMNVFRNYIWITNDRMNFKTFRQLSKIDFTDLRLKYDDKGKFFNLYLKKFNGKIVKLQAYPLKKRNKKRNKTVFEKYPAEYARYLTALARHSKQFDRNMLYNKQRVLAAIEKNKKEAWNTLRTYMSPAEREMSEQKWLSYYTDVLRYEDDALKASYPNESLFKRQLEKLGFGNKYDRSVDTTGIKFIKTYFTDEQDINVPVNMVVLIDKTSFTYKFMRLRTTVDPLTYKLVNGDDLAMIIYLPDNSVGIVSAENIASLIKGDTAGGTKASLFSPEMITIGQILNELEINEK